MTTPYQPPPDVTNYVDLRPYDVSDQEMVETVLAFLQVNLPEWVPREGDMMTLLVEAMSLEASETIVALNRLPGALLETLLRFIKINKDYGAPPTAAATVVCADSMGHQIPAGTRLYLPDNDGSPIVVLIRPPGLDIPSGQSTGTVSLIGDTFTASANGVPAGTTLQMASPLPYIDTVTLTTPVIDGRDPESDDDWRDRGVNRLSRLTDVLVYPRHFYAAALEDANVVRAVVVDNTDPANGTPGSTPGFVTVAVLGAGGATLSGALKNALQANLQATTHAALQVRVVDITIVVLTVAVSIHLSAASDQTATVAAVRQAVLDYVDPLTWSGGLTIRRNELISLVDQVAGVDYVNSVTITGANGSGDYVLTQASAVPDITTGSLTVTVA